VKKTVSDAESTRRRASRFFNGLKEGDRVILDAESQCAKACASADMTE